MKQPATEPTLSTHLRRRLLMALTASVVAMGATVRAQEPQFKLLLGIVVEGLDDAGLELLRDKFGPGGFALLGNNGVYVPTVDYGTPMDVTAATATLMTGAQPALSGIDGWLRYDRDRLRFSHIFADSETLGNFTQEGYSPKTLRVSTVSDEARIAGSGITLAYAVAPSVGQAVALGGHAANVTLWLDPATANWASSAYYREMPLIVATRNRVAPLSTRLDTMSWAPLPDRELFSMLPPHLHRYGFRYIFPRNDNRRIDMFMASPLVNSEVTAVACDLLNAGRLGSHEGGTDVLNVGYSLTTYPYGRNSDKRLEQLDATLRLDRNLEQLFKAVDRSVGLDHTLIYLAGTPARTRASRDDELWSIPYGEFSGRRAVSLLNMYLIALHGNGEYVSAFREGKLYLNRQTLKDKNLDGAAVRSEAAAFLMRMTGVDRAYTLEAILSGTAGEDAEALRRNTVVATAPDVAMTVSPGYELIDDFETAVDTSNGAPHLVRRAVPATAPLFIMAPQLAAARIDTPVDARAVAPTITRLLRIRSPNGASRPPMRLPTSNQQED